MQTVDIIIPTYRPTGKLPEIIKRLNAQRYPVNRIILMNTEERCFRERLPEDFVPENYRNLEIHHLPKREFDHGGTRRKGVSFSEADIFICMTDDALPADRYLTEHLVEALSQERVAVAYGRQMAGRHAGAAERFTRSYNYPPQSFVKSKEDLPRLGVKTYFCSNACAAYRRDIYEESGGFISHTIFNEDMIYAAGVTERGYRIAYAADAKVYHSHHYTNLQQLRRNFDLGVSQAQHPEIFAGLPSEGEGIRLVKETAVYLKDNGLALQIPGLCLTSACKYAGYLLGKQYRKLPAALIRSLTMNAGYWEQNAAEKESLS